MITLDVTKKYALAVSGGVDSMVMLHKFAHLLPRPEFFVVTVNHGIRLEAQADCDFVVNYCNELGVPCQVAQVDVPTYAKNHKLSLETAARILRYNVLDGLSCDYVCLAHHADDNAETVLMHILRGSGAQGAQGMQTMQGKYLRPLLNCTRKDLEAYASAHNVPFVVDSTNADTTYTRNYLRHKVMPQLMELTGGAAVQNLLRFGQNISADNQLLDSLADISTVTFGKNCASIPLPLLGQHAALAGRIVRKTFAKLGVVADVEKVHVDSIVALASASGGKSVSLPFGYVAINDYDAITIMQAEQPLQADFLLPFAVGATPTPVGTIVVSQQPLPNALRIAANKLPADAVFRTKRPGDTFAKFGGGTKSLKKYLIDSKIPQRMRDNLVVVASGSNVLVVVGVEIAQTLAITSPTDQILYVTKENAHNES